MNEVQARNGIAPSPLQLMPRAVNNSTPISSAINGGILATQISVPGLASSTTAAEATSQSSSAGQSECPTKRSWIFRGRVGRHLQVRQCGLGGGGPGTDTPGWQSPAQGGLLPSPSESTPQPAQTSQPAEDTSQSGSTANPACPTNTKRAWIFGGWVTRYLHRRGCAAPGYVDPVGALVPPSEIPSTSENEATVASSPEAQAEKASQPVVSPQTDSSQADTQVAKPQAAKDTQQTGSQPAKDTPEAESQAAKDTQQAAPQSASGTPANDNPEADSPAAKGTQQKASQSGSDTPEADTHAAKASPQTATKAAPKNDEGQTVPANGNPITVNNQLVRISAGSIYVGSSAAPIPQAQAIQSDAEPILAGIMNFHAASPTPVAQAAPSPVVVGGFTFSVAPSEPSSESKTTQNDSQAQPVVIGGKVYAPVEKTAEQGASNPSSSQEQSSTTLNSDSIEQAKSSQESSAADSKPIEIGGITYTPITSNPTSTPQNAGADSSKETTLAQGGATPGGDTGTSPSPSATPGPTQSHLTINSQTLTALPSGAQGFEIDHTTLLPGSSAIILSGTTYSLNTAGSLIIGTSTIALATSAAANSALTADGETFTPIGSTAAVVDGTTLSIGGPAITENGTRVSLASGGLLVGSSTFAYATPAVNAATVTGAGGSLSTGSIPSGLATTFPGATGGIGSSAASGGKSVPRAIRILFVVGASLYLM